MTLADLRLPQRANCHWPHLGIDHPLIMDSAEHCLDLKHWQNYPYEISYYFNSRGFRDREWPADLKSAAWCLGDSFTLGIGVPLEHTWPRIFEQHTGIQTINISMDGASNDWMSRRACQILDAVQPHVMIIQWSYTHRREMAIDREAQNRMWLPFYQSIRDDTWPDCSSLDEFSSLPEKIQKEIQQDPFYINIQTLDDHDRRLDIPSPELLLEVNANNQNLLDNIQRVEVCRQHCAVVHSFIPAFSENQGLTHEFLQQHLGDYLWLPEISQLDRARDGHHYDIKTAEKLVQDLVTVLQINKK
jgi:hypothetical protein